MILKLSFDAEKVRAAFQKAVNWADEFMSMQLSEG
jgi:hypothetical protein